MSNFTTLLIHSCTIQRSTLNLSGYEQTKSWSNLATSVPCRKDSNVGASRVDGDMRTNVDNEVFFFNPDAPVLRGDRIIFDGITYDVVDVSKQYDSKALHHLEVEVLEVDHQ